MEVQTAMDQLWTDDQPIYKQVREMVADMILDGMLQEGEALPVVRNVAAEFKLSPLTVLKGYRELVGEGVVETRRGQGMFVKEGAKKKLVAAEREKFLSETWPRTYDMILRLGLNPEKLLHLSGPAEGEVESSGDAEWGV